MASQKRSWSEVETELLNEISDLRCGLSNNGHFIRNPIALSCGHCICKSCFNLHANCSKIRCNICGGLNSIDLTKSNESIVVKRMFEMLSKNMFKFVEQEFEKLLQNFKNNVIETNESIEIQFGFVKEEIDIRIESIKIELEYLKDKLYAELDTSKNELLVLVNNFNDKKYEVILDEFKCELEKDKILTTDDFYDYEKKMLELKSLNETFQNTYKSVKVEFDASLSLKQNVIGQIKYNFFNPMVKFAKGDYKIQNLWSIQPNILCPISTNSLLVIDSSRCGYHFYDKCLKPTVSSIIGILNNQKCEPCCATSDGKSHIYITDKLNHQIIVVNSSFTFVNKKGVKGASDSQFMLPLGILYSNGSIYVCDSLNCRIQKFNPSLDFICSYAVDFEPAHIQITNNVACVSAVNKAELNFFHVDDTTFTNISKTDVNKGPICVWNSKFYHFSYDNKGKQHKMCCFNYDGSLANEISLDFPNEITFDSNFCNENIACFMDNFIITSSKSRRLIVF